MEIYHQHRPSQVGQVVSDVAGRILSEVRTLLLQWTAAEAVAASNNGVHAAVQDNGALQTISTGIGALPCPRNIRAVPGGTAGDIKAVSITVYGKRNGVSISEVLPAFTADSTNAVEGNKIFDSVDYYTQPAMDGTGATVSLGWGEKLGLPLKLERNTVLMAFKGDTREGTAPTVAVSATALESNSVDLNSALDGNKVEVYLVAP